MTEQPKSEREALAGLLREWQRMYNAMDAKNEDRHPSEADFRSLRQRTHEALAAPPQAAQPSSITLDFKQATELLEMFGGEPTEITLMMGDERSHSGAGVYAVYNADPEGSMYLGETDEEATPNEATPQAAQPASLNQQIHESVLLGAAPAPLTDAEIDAIGKGFYGILYARAKERQFARAILAAAQEQQP